MEKAYDMTWRYEILKNIYKLGIRGRMAEFVKINLAERNFQIEINDTSSGIKIQKEGIPQGSVASPTLFTIHIDQILHDVPDNNRLQSSMFTGV